MNRFIFCAFLIGSVALCLADSWPPPAPFVKASENGNIVVRVDPGFSKAGDDSRMSSHCRFYRYVERTKLYELWKEFDLVNRTLPETVVVPNDGSFLVTFDDYMGVGTTGNMIVVYDSSGRVRKRWSLKDVFTEGEIADLPRSTMSIHWRSDVGVMSTTQNEVYIAPPGPLWDKERKCKGFMLDVTTLIIREDPTWK
jgi:hypothetical protein